MKHSHAGFSLIEILVAMTILAAVFSVVFSGMSTAAKGLSRVDAMERRIEMARQRLNEIRLIENLKAGEIARGRFDDGTEWRIEASTFLRPPLESALPNALSVLRLELRLEWNNGKPQSWTIETYRTVSTASSPGSRTLETQLHELQ